MSAKPDNSKRQNFSIMHIRVLTWVLLIKSKHNAFYYENNARLNMLNKHLVALLVRKAFFFHVYNLMYICFSASTK